MQYSKHIYRIPYIAHEKNCNWPEMVWLFRNILYFRIDSRAEAVGISTQRLHNNIETDVEFFTRFGFPVCIVHTFGTS